MIKTFKFQADGGDITLLLGFVPDWLKLVNVTAMASAGNKAELEWFGENMGDAAEIEKKVLADNGTTGNKNLNYASSGGYIAEVNADDLTVDSVTQVYGVATVQVVGGLGVKITASGFMSDNDIIYGIAVQADINVSIGDIASLGAVIKV